MYYEVKVKLKIENDKGKIQKITESYLTSAVSCIDAETIVSEHFKDSAFEWAVTSVKETKFIDVLGGK